MSIEKLSPMVANQIAAGEVVERPAAVVKELCENALDAGATQIDIEILKGGSKLILVRDNGFGIEKNQLSLALERHATSKLKDLSDLDKILSLGFRGEALASISSVSRLTLRSRPEAQHEGWQVIVNGLEQHPALSPTAHPKGTSVEVRDLFYNTPARRKFLRTEKTESQRIEDVLYSLALSHFDIGFSYKNNNQLQWSLKPALNQSQKEQRITKLFKAEFLDNAIYINTKQHDFSLTGWLGDHEYSRPHNDIQMVFLNGRAIRDKVITHAIRQAYNEHLFPGRHPAYILSLQCDPATVDVNVHPTKHEVRFAQSRLVHDFLSSEIEKSLFAQPPMTTPTVNPPPVVQPQNNYHSDASSIAQEKPLPITHSRIEQQLDFYKKPLIAKKEIKLPTHKTIGLYKNKKLLIESPDGLGIINLKKAQIILLENQMEEKLKSGNLTPYTLTVPLTILANQNQINIIENLKTTLDKYGIDCESTGPDQILFKTIPVLLRGVDINNLFDLIVNNPDEFDTKLCALKPITPLENQIARDSLANSVMALPKNLQKKCIEWILDTDKHTDYA